MGEVELQWETLRPTVGKLGATVGKARNPQRDDPQLFDHSYKSKFTEKSSFPLSPHPSSLHAQRCSHPAPPRIAKAANLSIVVSPV